MNQNGMTEKEAFGNIAKTDSEMIVQVVSDMPRKKSAISIRLKEVSNSFKDVRRLIEKEHELFSIRQDLVDYKNELLRVAKSLAKQKKKADYNGMMNLKQGGTAQFKPANKTEENIYKDFKERDLTFIIDTIDIQIKWCQDSIKSCDEMNNGISYLIKLLNMQH